jgi:hypothetical protein
MLAYLDLDTVPSYVVIYVDVELEMWSYYGFANSREEAVAQASKAIGHGHHRVRIMVSEEIFTPSTGDKE